MQEKRNYVRKCENFFIIFTPLGNGTTYPLAPLEISVAQRLFPKNILENQLPSLSEYREVIKNNSELQDRNETQLKLWVNSQIKKTEANEIMCFLFVLFN